MHPFVPKRFEPVVFSLLLSWFMTFVVSGISTLLAVGVGDPGFLPLWLKAWISSWIVAFPALLLVAPFVRLILRRIVIT